MKNLPYRISKKPQFNSHLVVSAAIPLILALLLFPATGCNKDGLGSSGKSDKTNSGSSSGFSSSSLQVPQPFMGSESQIERKPKLPIRKSAKLLEVLDANLDLDETEEQVLLVKDTGDTASPLEIMVIDHDEVKDIYVKAWEGASNATNPRIYEIEITDVVGESSPQIVLHGMNARDLTLDIFRRTPSLSFPGLYFQPICQIVSNGTIRIQKTDRSTLYEIGQKSGESFPIIVERRGNASGNDLDIVEETYGWTLSTRRYELVSSRHVPADIASQAKLSSLYATNDEKPFYDFLKGPWFDKKQTDKLVAFYPEQNQIVFALGNVSEVYDVDYSKRTLYNSFMIVAHNILIKSIKVNLSVIARSPNAIDIHVEDETWSGEYQKLEAGLEDNFYSSRKKSVKPSDLRLYRKYSDKEESPENQIVFEPPNFTWDIKGKRSLGGFAVIENIPVTNPNYYKTVLQFLPSEMDNNTFTNSVRKKISSEADDQLLSKCYSFDRAANSFILNELVSRNDMEHLWKLFVAVQYKGYTEYHFGVITFKTTRESGLVERIDNYVLEYAEKKESDKIIRTLILTPCNLNVNGVEVISRDSIHLVQHEDLQSD